jgi:ABC-type transport system involved in cytochrome bd biosynthesis fused ATPase/permease subunit
VLVVVVTVVVLVMLVVLVVLVVLVALGALVLVMLLVLLLPPVLMQAAKVLAEKKRLEEEDLTPFSPWECPVGTGQLKALDMYGALISNSV